MGTETHSATVLTICRACYLLSTTSQQIHSIILLLISDLGESHSQDHSETESSYALIPNCA
jgi:hypothetical protein